MNRMATIYPAYISDREHPDPEWNDQQRTAHRAAQLMQRAYLQLDYAHRQGAIPSYEPVHRAWLAFVELERELAITGLFGTKEH